MTSPNTAYRDWLNTVADPFEAITSLEKSEVSNLELSDITEALDEYVRLFQAEIASPAEVLTLSRAYPDEEKYSLAVIDKEYDQDEPVVIGGPASVEVVDREGHIITVAAMKRAFERFMDNFRTRNAMVLHSDVQVGWALPAYISKTGKIYKSGVTGDHLFFITELRSDTKISKKVLQQIEDGKMKSYSIAGSATSVETVKHDSGVVMQVNDMELAEVTICEQGVNQRAKFELMKSDADRPTSSCVDGSCLIKSQEHKHSETEVFMNNNGEIDTVGSFSNWVQKEDAMQKSHLEGCGCASCTQHPGDDDTARTATDTQGRPTLGHMGHGNVVAIMISRMQRKAEEKAKPGEKGYHKGDPYPKLSRMDLQGKRAKGDFEQDTGYGPEEDVSYKQHVWREDNPGKKPPKSFNPEATREKGKMVYDMQKAKDNIRRGTPARNIAADKQSRYYKPSSRNTPQYHPTRNKTKAELEEIRQLDDHGRKVQLSQKAVYEYLNKEYVVPSKEDLAEAGKARQQQAEAKWKEANPGKELPSQQSRSMAYRGTASETFRQPRQTGDERKAASQALWRKKNPGKEDPASFADMLKALIKNQDPSMEPPAVTAPKGPSRRKGLITEGMDADGNKTSSVIGNLVRSAQRYTSMNMEKQAPEWTTPQTETPLHKFLDHVNEGKQ